MGLLPAHGPVAVTGASGFIGSHVCQALVQKGFEVRACVRDPTDAAKTAHLAKMGGEDGRVTLWRGDLLEAGSFDAAFSGCCAVVHVAAVVEIRAVKDPMRQIVEPSIKGCENVLASVEKSGSVRRFVHTSSCIAVAAVDTKQGARYDEADLNEWSTLETDAYGYAKSAAEQLVRKRCGELGLSLATILPGVTLGPCLTKQHTKASTVLLRELLYANKMLNYNCSFADVRDVADAHAACVASEAAGRFLCVCEEGAMNTTELGAIAKRACPQFETQAVPMYSLKLLGFLRGLYSLPGLGPFVVENVLSLTDFQLRVFEEKLEFDNGRAKNVLGLTFRPLETTVRDGILSMVDGGWVVARAAEN